MTTTATRNEQSHTTEATLFVAFELSEKTWKLGFTTGHGQKPRERTVTARQQERVLDEIAQAKRRLGLPEAAPVVRRARRCWGLCRYRDLFHLKVHVWIPALEDGAQLPVAR